MREAWWVVMHAVRVVVWTDGAIVVIAISLLTNTTIGNCNNLPVYRNQPFKHIPPLIPGKFQAYQDQHFDVLQILPSLQPVQNLVKVTYI